MCRSSNSRCSCKHSVNLFVVVDDSSSMAVAKDVHDFVESKPSANAGVNVSTSNVCEKSVDAVSHSSDKLVQSVTVKNEPKTGDDVCTLKDEKDKPATLCGKECQKNKIMFIRTRSLSNAFR